MGLKHFTFSAIHPSQTSLVEFVSLVPVHTSGRSVPAPLRSNHCSIANIFAAKRGLASSPPSSHPNMFESAHAVRPLTSDGQGETSNTALGRGQVGASRVSTHACKEEEAERDAKTTTTIIATTTTTEAAATTNNAHSLSESERASESLWVTHSSSPTSFHLKSPPYFTHSTYCHSVSISCS